MVVSKAKAQKTKQKQASLSSEEVKLKILTAAKQHFAQSGYNGANLKDIAKTAGVASSLINYHYQGREGLFKSCIELFAYDRMQALNRLLTEAENRDELKVRLELFVNEIILSHLNDPHSFEIMQREIMAENPIVTKLFKETMLLAFKNVCDFFAKAQKKGFIGEDFDPLILASLLFSAACDMARKDHLSKKFFNISIRDEGRRKNVTRHLVTLFMDGVVK